MFQKIVFLLPLFLLPVANAQIGSQIVKQIEKVNHPDLGVTNPSEPCEVCAAEKNGPAIFAGCVKKICADRGLVPYSQIPELSDADLSRPAPNEAELAALFDKWHGIKFNIDTEEERNKLYEAMKSGKSILSDDNVLLGFQFLVLTVGYRALKWNPITYQAEFDEAKFAAIPKVLSTENTEALRQAAIGYIAKMPNLYQLMSERADTPGVYLATKYPGLSKVNAVKKLIVDFRSDYEDFKKSKFGQIVFKMAGADYDFFPQELVDDIESGKDLAESDLRELIEAKKSYSTMKTLVPAELKLPAGVDLDDLKKRIGSPENLRVAIQKQRDDQKKTPAARADEKAACLSIYRRNNFVLPDHQQRAALESLIKEVKKDISTKWAPRYSEQTRKKISEYLDGVDFFLPPSREEYKIGFKRKLLREIQKSEKNKNLVLKDRDTLAFFMVMSSFTEKFADPEKKDEDKSDAKKYCEKDKFDALNDANYTLLGKIQLSYTTALAPRLGRGVIAHELGHGISRLFLARQTSDESAHKHQALLGCLASSHAKSGEKYIEEDYADFTAAHVSPTNVGCLFPLSYSASSKAVDNSPAEDSHSAAFYRLLHFESLQTGRLPDECNQLLVAQGTPKDFLRCEK